LSETFLDANLVKNFKFHKEAKMRIIESSEVMLSIIEIKEKKMKESKIYHPSTFRRWALIGPAIVMLGLTACSTTGGTARRSYSGGYADISPRAYNTESRSFDRPWPFGPESTQQ
jgi:hypothetical protein